MYSSFSLPFSLESLGFRRRRRSSVTVPAVPFHDVEEAQDTTSKRLHSLLKLNHANYSVLFNDLRFHNHTPHILGSAYTLGGTPDQLTKVYEAESSSHEPWSDAPGEISEDDWRDFLGQREYQRAYIDFFEDQLVAFGYDWKALLEHYLYSGDKPLINSLVSCLGHPLIHLGYAYELGSRTVAIEALTLGACCYSSLHKYIDDPSYTKPPPSSKTTSVLEIFERIRKDSRLDKHSSNNEYDTLVPEIEEILLEHWNAWDVSSTTLRTCLLEAQKGATALVVATPDHSSTSTAAPTAPAAPAANKGAEGKDYDFVFLHVLTISHALRILLPLMPDTSQVPVVRSWLLFTLLAYIDRLRPRIDLAEIDEYPLEYEDAAGKNKGKEASWKHVKDAALNGPHLIDAHYVKGLRALWVAEETWGDDVEDESGTLDRYWRKAAVRLAKEFKDWF